MRAINKALNRLLRREDGGALAELEDRAARRLPARAQSVATTDSWHRSYGVTGCFGSNLAAHNPLLKSVKITLSPSPNTISCPSQNALS